MTDEERAEVLLTARLLRAGCAVGMASLGLTLLAAAALWLRVLPPVLPATGVLVGLFGAWFGVRVLLDARLFEDVAAGRLSAEELDEALVRAGFATGVPGARPWTDRCRGARRLLGRLGATTLVQIALAIAAGAAGGRS